MDSLTCNRKEVGWKSNKRILVEKEESFIDIPIIESSKQFFTNETLAKVIFRKINTCNDEFLYDMCDGEYYRNDKLFIDNQDTLIIIIYHDVLEVCNSLDSHAGTHKIDTFYSTMENLSPKFWSKRYASRLLAIVKSNILKKYGYNAILKPIIYDIKKLGSGYLLPVC